MFIYYKFKYFREVHKGRSRSIITNKGTAAFLEDGTAAACFLGVGKCCRYRPRLICFGSGAKITEKPFIIKIGMSSSLMDVVNFRSLIAFKMSTSKTKDNNYKSSNMKFE